jgi:hypothetical protein
VLMVLYLGGLAVFIIALSRFSGDRIHRRRTDHTPENPSSTQGLVSAELHALREQQRKQDWERAKRETRTLVALVVAGVAALVSAALLGIQLNDARQFAKRQHQDTIEALAKASEANEQSRRSADAAVRSAEAAARSANDQVRPILWLGAPDPDHPERMMPHFGVATPQGKGRIAWSMPYVNYGKGGPATHVMIGWCMKINDAARATHKDKCVDPGAVAPVAPGPAGVAGYFTAVTDAEYTSDDFNQFLGADLAITMTARITYLDVYGRSFETDICLRNFSTGAINYCPEGNEIK